MIRPYSKDGVFQLSLAEVAWILAFIFLLLMGILYVAKKREADQLTEKVAALSAANKELAAVASFSELQEKYRELRRNIEKYLKEKAVPAPDRLLDDLVSAAAYEAEIRRLEEKLAEKDRSIEACPINSPENQPSKEDILRALALNQEVVDLLTRLQAKEPSLNDLSALERYLKDVIRKAADARQQCGRKAISACWKDDKGQTQNLLRITLEKDHAVVEVPELPPERLAEMASYPGIELAIRKIIPYEEFKASFGPILKWSQSRSIECRHYVAIRSNIPLTRESTKRRLQVQDYFWPDETGALK